MAIKKILFISHDGMTDPLGQSQVIPYLSSLTKFGYSFTILSCDKPARYTANKAYVEKLIASYPIQWVSIPYHKGIPVLSAMYDYYALRKRAEALLHTQRFDMVHTRPGLPSLVGIHLKQKFGIKFLNDIRGFWADERVDGEIWNIKNPLYKQVYLFFKKHEQACLSNADYNVCLTSKAHQNVLARNEIAGQPLPVTVIPCSVDTVLFDPANIDRSLKDKIKAELDIHADDFIISYLGSLGGWYLTHEMMRFCKSVSDQMPNARFLFISPDSFDSIAAAAIKCGLAPDRLIVRHGKRHEVPVLLSFSSYSLFFIKPCFSKIASSPTKHGEIMAMGIPVITNSGVGDVEEIVARYQSGYVLHDFSDESFNKVIDKIKAGNEFNQLQIRNAAEEFYSLDRAVESYRNVYASILK